MNGPVIDDQGTIGAYARQVGHAAESFPFSSWAGFTDLRPKTKPSTTRKRVIFVAAVHSLARRAWFCPKCPTSKRKRPSENLHVRWLSRAVDPGTTARESHRTYALFLLSNGMTTFDRFWARRTTRIRPMRRRTHFRSPVIEDSPLHFRWTTTPGYKEAIWHIAYFTKTILETLNRSETKENRGVNASLCCFLFDSRLAWLWHCAFDFKSLPHIFLPF